MQHDDTANPWQGRVDALDGAAGRRWHQVVQPLDQATQPGVALCGLASDAGVRRNHGRPGAAEGPRTLRRYLANLAWHGTDRQGLYDAGDVAVVGDALEPAQSEYAHRVAA